MSDRPRSSGPAWEGSTRRRRLPPDWETIRRRILRRDGWRCTAVDDGRRCSRPASDVDHVQHGDDHRPSNLASLCSYHHRKKSSAEGNAARERPTMRRPPEPHPGLKGES